MIFFFAANGQNSAEKIDTCYVTAPSTLCANDCPDLSLKSNCSIDSFHFELYNRWGELLFQADDNEKIASFDIYERKKTSPKEYRYVSGTYFYVVSYVRREGSIKFQGESNGTITIIL